MSHPLHEDRSPLLFAAFARRLTRERILGPPRAGIRGVECVISAGTVEAGGGRFTEGIAAVEQPGATDRRTGISSSWPPGWTAARVRSTVSALMGWPRSKAWHAMGRFVARWIAILLLATVSVQASAAWAFPCGGGHCSETEDGGRDEDGGHDEDGCSCPVPCGTGCPGHVPPALPPTLPLIELPLVASLSVLSALPGQRPPPGTFVEILHVPKAQGA